MKKLHCILGAAGGLLVVIGSLNWGIQGLFHVSILESALSSLPGLLKALYVLTLISGLGFIACGVMRCKNRCHNNDCNPSANPSCHSDRSCGTDKNSYSANSSDHCSTSKKSCGTEDDTQKREGE